MHPSLSSDYSTGTWNNLNGWTVLNAAETRFAHETVIDLSGYAMESLTFFPAAIGLQDPGFYTYLPGAASTYNGMQVLDIVTSVPMDLDAVANAQGSGIGPGMLGSDYEFETILFGMFRFFTANTNIPYANYQQLERSQRFDSGEPNASDKLFCYRIVTLLSDGPPEPTSRFAVPAARQLIGGAMDEESELVYMQRLKRSYELANQV
tara:strand:- start:529 stop:1149 length:621 start_codon:yes stop_codon:yes gene_type:complete